MAVWILALALVAPLHAQTHHHEHDSSVIELCDFFVHQHQLTQLLSVDWHWPDSNSRALCSDAVEPPRHNCATTKGYLARAPPRLS
ncbi:hypothetical protein [Ferrimonas pelagia]|uniref:Secreted protein n=1 Tax=Ferrimonas pelagia TaxID=1177826 RepID=A0ABP9EAT8_9GAMM